MSTLQAILLGILQGITEFLPVSSSGHLELAKELFGLNLAKSDSLTVSVVVHIGTALSTVVVFRKDIGEIFKGLFKFKWNTETKFAAFIVLSMIPAAVIGLLFEDQIEELFDGQLLLVAAMLVITGLLLFLADRAKRTHKDISGLEAIVMGIAQAIAILPGISRSGATISTSVLLGVDRERAARFSFLMVLPLILGKALMDVKNIVQGEAIGAEVGTASLLLACLAAFITGVIACRLMIQLVKNAQLKWFAFYCFIVGGGVLLYQMF